MKKMDQPAVSTELKARDGVTVEGFGAKDGRNVASYKNIYTMAGRFLPKPVACSKACAICKTLKSAPARPTICTPTGSPSGVNPPGTEAAGFPTAEMYQQDFIQSM